MPKRLSVSLIGLVLMLLQALFAPAMAQDSKLDKKELDQLLAPIALYPDELITNILMASTYPLDVVQAARWVKEPDNAKLKGDALAKALESKEWDPSIKALVQFPTVLQNMSDKLDWTQKLGDAFLAQQDEVMDQIQFLRQKADEAGNLKSNKRQKVTKETGEGGSSVYVIEPAESDVVYVPYYQPAVVYGDWWYEDYPPYYWDYAGADYIDGWWWGGGIAIASAIWGWNHCDWRRHNINIDVNKWNRIDRDRTRISDGRWQHRPEQRGSVAYRNKDVRDRFAKGDRKPGSKDFRNFDRGNIDRSKVEARLRDTNHANVKNKLSDRAAGDNLKGKIGEGGGAKFKDKSANRDGANLNERRAGDNFKGKVGGGGGAKFKDKAANRDGANLNQKRAGASQGTGNRARTANFNRPKAQRPSAGVRRGNVGRAAARGNINRVARGGGGPRKFTGGGGPRRFATGGGPGRFAGGGPRGGRSFAGGCSRGGGGGFRGGGRGGGRRSDVAVKHDITLLGRFANGMGFYRFAYNGDQKLYVGVMAQDAMKVMPQVVSRDGEGYLRVDYDKMGLPFQTYEHWLESGARIPQLTPE